jgi:hypothetical protein
VKTFDNFVVVSGCNQKLLSKSLFYLSLNQLKVEDLVFESVRALEAIGSADIQI